MGLPYSNQYAELLGGNAWIKRSGSWEPTHSIHAKDSGGTWRRAKQHYIKSGGTWREVHKGNVYRFQFDLNNNNAGTSAKTVNTRWMECTGSNIDDLQTGSYNTIAADNYTFDLDTALSYSGYNTQGGADVYGVVYVNSWQRSVTIPNITGASKVLIVVGGGRRIMGKGGNGSAGQNTSNTNGGQNGQTALYVREDSLLINNGQIAGGGGGGGGGRGGQCTYQNTGQYGCMKGSQCQATYQNFSTSQGGGGGGGIGYPGGQRGTGGNNGQNGSVNAPGNGGGASGCGSVSGGRGGGWGSSAQGGGGRGTPGSGGNAIDGVSYINKLTSGTINGGQVN